MCLQVLEIHKSTWFKLQIQPFACFTLAISEINEHTDTVVLYLFALLLVTFILKQGRVSLYGFKFTTAGTEKCQIFNVFGKIFGEIALKFSANNLKICCVLKVL